jgi:F-type H+-transporting ATPase subunit epsilon
VAKTFRFKLITPEERVIDQDATYVSMPLHDGLTGVMPGRAPLVARLGLGELRVDFPSGGSRSFFLDGGFGQMIGDSLTVLAQEAVSAEQLVEKDAQAELAEASARTSGDGDQMRTITHDRERARLKIRLASRVKKTGV